MNSKQIVNPEARKLGKQVTAADRVLIQNKLNVTESTVNVVLTGKRRAMRGKSLQIIELARKIAEINLAKENLL
ncbi:hypothetical protein [Carboxylicivirga linearis]|uniref:DNA-binding protein n=1 Tax=Carboxylicivirga linearis TaxID=1628157 RepID=A0ABS5JZX9_9BACT|nr:hypothetical protein [Carboxylicivirga linearis]MBS2100423.1 hypothetical protein [Carboxylicivirga linearis]